MAEPRALPPGLVERTCDALPRATWQADVWLSNNYASGSIDAADVLRITRAVLSALTASDALELAVALGALTEEWRCINGDVWRTNELCECGLPMTRHRWVSPWEPEEESR